MDSSSHIPSIVRKTKLPSPSPVIMRLLDLVYTPDSEIDELIDAVQGDAVLTAKILRSANSVSSFPASKIDNLKDAVTRIGMIPIINIITATETASMFFSVPLPYGDICKLWEHNLLVACLSSSYASHHKLDNPGRWFNTGLMHDLGRLVLICHDPVKYHETIAYSEMAGVNLSTAEKNLFGHSHSEIGALLIEFLELPSTFAEAAAGHHLPFVSIDDYASGIGVCNRIANDLLLSDPPHIHSFEELPLDMVIGDAVVMFDAINKAAGLESC